MYIDYFLDTYIAKLQEQVFDMPSSTHMVWINCTEGEVLCRDAHLCEHIEECAFPNIGKSHNPNLHS